MISGGKPVTAQHLPFNTPQTADTPEPVKTIENSVTECHNLNEQVEQLERRLIQDALNKTSNNKAKAAQQLKISERSLWYKIKKYALS